MTIMEHEYTDRAEAGKALLSACALMKDRSKANIGKYKGFDMSVKYDAYYNKFKLTLKRNMEYTTELGKDESGNITQINNSLNNAAVQLDNSRATLENL
ncbi:MAG: hypothetical protein ACI4EA_06440 [Candidatus Ornithomonoglobus sp.]